MCWLLTVKHSPFSNQEYPERSRFQTVSKDLLISFGICPVNQFVYSDCDVLFSFSLSALSVIFSVLAFSSYPAFEPAPFVSTPNPPFSAHSLFLTFLSELHHFRRRSSSFLHRLGLFVLFPNIPFLGFTQTLNRSVAVLLRYCFFGLFVILLQASRIRGRLLFFYDFF